jgi:hypothetical protein
VPKSLRRINEEFQGLPIRYVAVIVVVALTCLILIITILSAKNKIIPLIILFVVLAFFFKFMRSTAILTRSWLAYKFLIRGLRGQNVVAKYTSTATFMTSIVPIVEFHDAGVIEFAGKKYGMMLKVDPDRVSDDEIETHINQVRSLIDSLHGELMLKSYVVSVPTTVRPVEKGIVKLLNEQGRTKQEQDHLYSLYNQALENTSPVIQWKFYIFLGLGKYDNLQDAYIAKQQYFPGLINKLTKAGMHIIPVRNKQELGQIYRSLISQVQS